VGATNSQAFIPETNQGMVISSIALFETFLRHRSHVEHCLGKAIQICGDSIVGFDKLMLWEICRSRRNKRPSRLPSYDWIWIHQQENA
jgi:hypothetical protein